MTTTDSGDQDTPAAEQVTTPAEPGASNDPTASNSAGQPPAGDVTDDEQPEDDVDVDDVDTTDPVALEEGGERDTVAAPTDWDAEDDADADDPAVDITDDGTGDDDEPGS